MTLSSRDSVAVFEIAGSDVGDLAILPVFWIGPGESRLGLLQRGRQYESALVPILALLVSKTPLTGRSRRPALGRPEDDPARQRFTVCTSEGWARRCIVR
jgi:hypothetical protein